MSENKLIDIAGAIKEIKDLKSIDEADKTSALLVRTIHAALSPLEKWVIEREYSLKMTEKLLERKLQSINPENIITPPTYIAVPALQSISYCMDDEYLRDMYAELLAHAMNSETVDNVHPTYVEIIKQMSPYDALIFKKIVKKVIQPCISISYKNKLTNSSYPIQDLITFDDSISHPFVPTQIALENLERLRLIQIDHNSKLGNSSIYENLKSSADSLVRDFVNENNHLNSADYEVVYNEFVIVIRAFGQFFARVCLGETFESIR